MIKDFKLGMKLLSYSQRKKYYILLTIGMILFAIIYTYTMPSSQNTFNCFYVSYFFALAPLMFISLYNALLYTPIVNASKLKYKLSTKVLSTIMLFFSLIGYLIFLIYLAIIYNTSDMKLSFLNLYIICYLISSTFLTILTVIQQKIFFVSTAVLILIVLVFVAILGNYKIKEITPSLFENINTLHIIIVGFSIIPLVNFISNIILKLLYKKNINKYSVDQKIRREMS